MIRKLLSLFLLPVLLVSCAAGSRAESAASEEAPAVAAVEEMEVDITELIQAMEEEKAKEKKDSDGAYLFTVTCTGDFTIGGDNYHHNDIFTPVLEDHGGDINFTMQNVRSILADDDLTLVNFEGTLTDTTYVPADKKENSFLFNITPSAVSVLPDNSIEAVSLDNNHVYDHGDQGYEDTKAALSEAGVIYSTPKIWGEYDYKGLIRVGMLSFNCLDRYGTGFQKKRFREEYTEEFLAHETFEEAVCAEIAKAKEIYDLVIVSFHWGKEPTKTNPAQGYIPTANQIKLGRMAVDAGADLVIGNHSHRIQPIEYYNDKFICYSLGNFCFAGNSKPSDMSSILFQVRYRVKDGVISYRDFRIVPIRISSNNKTNDFIPTPHETDSIETDSILMMLTDPNNIKDLDWAVTDFPLTWKQ